MSLMGLSENDELSDEVVQRFKQLSQNSISNSLSIRPDLRKKSAISEQIMEKFTINKKKEKRFSGMIQSVHSN